MEKRYDVFVANSHDKGFASKTAAIKRAEMWAADYPELVVWIRDNKTGQRQTVCTLKDQDKQSTGE